MSSNARLGNAEHPMRQIGQVFRSFAKLVDAPLRQLGLAFGQLPVLVTLKSAGALSQAELVRIAQVEQASMAQLLNRMERDGLVKRVPDPADGRSRLVLLTARASRQLSKGKSVMDEACETALAGFSAHERAQLLQWLLRIDANLEQALTERPRA